MPFLDGATNAVRQVIHILWFRFIFLGAFALQSYATS